MQWMNWIKWILNYTKLEANFVNKQKRNRKAKRVGITKF